MTQPLLPMWKAAKKAFETTAGKKRPGMNPSKAAKFFKAFQNETGLTPACETFDKLAAGTKAKWQSFDEKKREVALLGLDAALDDVKKKGKAYREQLAKSIDTELDGDGDMVRALKNLDSSIEMILKEGKQESVSWRSLLEVEKKKLDPMAASQAMIIADLKSTSASLLKGVAGMEILLRNIKADPTRDNYVKQMSEPAMPVRYVTTLLQKVRLACKQSPEVKKAIGDIHEGPLAALLDYGDGKKADDWAKQLGTGNEKNAVLHHCAAMESQVAKLRLVAGAIKRVGA